jgi:hypothetical protein
MSSKPFFRLEDKRQVDKLIYYLDNFGVDRSEMFEKVKEKIVLKDPFSMTDEDYAKWQRYIDELIRDRINSYFK